MVVTALTCSAMFTNCGFREEKSSSDRTYWKYSGITGKGKVKNYLNTNYALISDTVGKFRKANELGFTTVAVEYTESGLWTEYNYKKYNPDGSIVEHTQEIIIWDEKGNSLERRDYKLGIFSRKWVYTNDNRGNVIETKRFNASDSLLSVFAYRFDEKDNNIEVRRYNGTDSLISKTLNKFDNNNLIESVIYDTFNTLNIKTLYKYDNSGNRIEKADFDANENLIEKITYQYNEKGFISEINSEKSVC